MRQFIVDLQAEHPAFRPNEIATICDLHFGRRPSPHTVQRVLAEGPPATRKTRRFPPYQEMTDPATARHAIITLHAEGWNAKSIAAYLATSRQTVHTTLRRWIEEGRLGLEDKSPGPKPGFRAVDFKTMTTIEQKQQENPRLGGFRMHAALLRLGIRVSVRTCNRIMAHHRAL
jgi:transposase